MTTPQLSRPERIAVARLHALLELLPRVLDQQLSGVGLTWFEFTVLESLHEAPDNRLRLSALAASTNATLPRLSRVVTGLEKRGLVVRVACTQDGRATNAVLTAQGAEAYRAAVPTYVDSIRSHMLAGFDDDGVGDLSRMTLTILAQLDPNGHLAVTAETTCAADPAPVGQCAADPV